VQAVLYAANRMREVQREAEVAAAAHAAEGGH
jgi:hypothetical protein